MSSDLTILFLDFDGVLHAVGTPSEEQLVHLPRFEATLREYPAVRIVLSTSWQDAYSIRALRALFSEDIAARIVGGTRGADPNRDAPTRYGQIQRFLRHGGAPKARWLALDDAVHDFPDPCPQLVACDAKRGFDADAEKRLRTALAASPPLLATPV